MGLIHAAIGSASGVLGDQWKEYFYCEAIPADTLVVKGRKKQTLKSSNTSTDNIITNGSIIVVADGQCMIIVEDGKVVDYCAEPGDYKYDSSTEPSLFDGGKLADNIKAVFENMGKRFTFGGESPKDQRIYYFNTKELPGNKYGTPNPIPFRVVDNRAGIDIDVAIKCFGEYSLRITNPILFYTNVCGNVSSEYTRGGLDSQMKSELLTALQPAFAQISSKQIRYSELPAHTMELADELNKILSPKWKELRGIEIVSFGINSVVADEKDEAMLQDLQKAAAFKDPTMAAAYTVGQSGQAMVDAANNANGSANGFVGVGMAQNLAGNTAASLYAAGQTINPANTASWTCSCGTANTGNFCSNCGKPNPNGAWTCSCGQVNNGGNFCSNCGKSRQ